MPRFHQARLLLAVLLAGALVAPVPIDARQPRVFLRGGLTGIASGRHAIDPTIVTRLQDGRQEIAVSVRLDRAPDAVTRGRLRAAGISTRGAWRTSIEGFVAPSRLRDVAAIPGVRTITPIRRPIETSFVGPGPALHGATAWQQAGYAGTGIKVGIIDGGFDGFAARMGTELPASVEARCYPQMGLASASLSDCVTPGDSHGTSVAEAIIDMAPGASLYVSNALSQADIAAAITWMTSAGVRVINFSRASPIFLEGMGDGTSTYLDSTYGLVDLAVGGGALFVAAAGNMALSYWTGPASDADADSWVEVAGDTEANSIVLGAGETVVVALRWASPASDYDLTLWRGETMVATAEDAQPTTGDPFEFLFYTAPDAGTYDIAVRHASGAAAPTLRLMSRTSAKAPLSYRVAAGSLPTPADSRNPGMLSVGAVGYQSLTLVEPYSSRGPTLDGRTKPDLVAADCAPTTVEPMFCGTSESAPFVSGAAALLAEANPTWTPVQLADYLRTHASPIGSPVPNHAAGYGLLSLSSIPVPTPSALAFLAPAASGTAGAPLLGQPIVGLLDASGALVTTGPGATLPVSLSIATNPGGGTFSCPTGTTIAATGGLARFTGCAIDQPAIGYVLRADAPGIAGVTSAPFAVASPGPAPALTLTASPTTVAYGGSVSLSAQAALPAGANLAIEAESGVGGLYAAPGASTTDASGLAFFAHQPVISSDYRVRATLPGTGIVEVSAPVHVRVNATATLASSVPSGRTVYRTTRIALTETIRPIGALVARGRARFDLFQRTSTGWARRRTLYANADAAGRARLTITLSSAGSWWIRSRAEPTATNGASAWTAGYRYSVRL